MDVNTAAECVALAAFDLLDSDDIDECRESPFVEALRREVLGWVNAKVTAGLVSPLREAEEAEEG